MNLPPNAERVRAELMGASDVLAANAAANAAVVAAMAARIVGAIVAGGKVIAFGNGGSASDAEHFAAELVGAYLNRSRRGLPAVSLTVNSSAVTAIANDFGFEAVFARQVEALGRPGDVALGISTSGNSANVNAALDRARALGLVTMGFAGRGGGAMAARCDLLLVVPSDRTPRIQEAHIASIHALCGLVEEALA